MDGERSDGEPEVGDEFACAGMLRGSLASLHGTVERIFSVRFSIGAEDISGSSNGQIWLKLQGQSNDVKAAKLFVKGVVNQEEQQEVSYPQVLHCVFCGAKGLFMDCLIKNTSAQIVIGSPGFLLISGLAEPVVRAYSLITDLVERCEDTQARRTDTGDRGAGFGESVDSRRTFKTLVEKWEDRHTLDLLVLPGTVKEILLDLVTDSGLGGSSHIPALVDGNAGARLHSDSEGRWDSSTDRWVDGTTTANSLKDSPANHSFSRSFSLSDSGRGSAEGAKVRLMHSPQEVGEEEQPEKGAGLVTEVTEGQGQEREQDLQLSLGNKEFLLLKFFTAMGYTEDVVKRVIARTGPKEASQILDFVQQEQDRSDRKQNQDGGAQEDASNRNERNRPCETEHREDEKAMDESKNGEVGEVSRQCEGASGGTIEGTGGVEAMLVAAAGQEEDFVLGVLKKAAVSCGYMEQNVAKVYSMLPDRSTHQLILELQREESKELEAERRKEGPREMDDVVLEKEKEKERPKAEAIRDKELFKPAEKRESVDKGWAEVNLSLNDKPPANHHTAKPIRQQPSKLQSPHQINLPVVKGPPVSTYPTTALDVPMNFQSNSKFDRTIFWPDPSTSKQNQSNQDNVLNLVAPQTSNNALKRALQGPQLPFFSGNDLSPTRARERRRFAATPSVVVTGEQRFLEGLQAPFELQLMDKPGDPKLRAVIIDGSNVAMSHGLGNFFSCRGIALAVQHFWDRGHRHISALLPQWRQKNDPRIKERHYLSALQNVGLVSYTPSREVEGKRISSYDDRFMLQHAQKTNGVIVTNDNLRDLSDESAMWRDIIKKRLLQYTFVGDHFMVPDDPLGRGGPHLDDFLRSEHRTPDPGNHTFAGLASNFPPSQPPPRSQTEVLNFRDRTLGGALDGTHSRGWGQGRGRGVGHGKGWGAGHRLGGTTTDRSPHETASLRERLCQVFVGQDNMVALVLQCHSAETDVNVLSDLILEQQKD